MTHINSRELSIGVRKCLIWTDHHFDLFNPRIKEQLFTHQDKFKMKSFAELCLVISIIKEAKDYRLLDATSNLLVEKLNQRLVNTLKDAAFFKSILLNPALYDILKTALLLAYIANPDDDVLKSNIIRLHQLDFFDSRNSPAAFRVFETRLLLDKCGVKKFSVSQKKRILESTILGNRKILPIDIGISEEYEITHILFYLSDFGKQNILSVLKEEVIKEISEVLVFLSGQNIIRNNLDLLGEFVMCLNYLNVDHPIKNTAIKKILNTQQHDGVVPFLTQLSIEKIEKFKLTNIKESIKRVVVHYHTTFVCLLAFYSQLTFLKRNGRNI